MATLQSVATSAYSATPLTITKPSGLAVGDLMILHYHTNGTMSSATGWTHEVNNLAVNNSSLGVMYKVADSSDVAASDFSFSHTDNAAGAILRIDDYAATDLLNKATDIGGGEGGDTFTVSVTPITTSQLLLFFTGTQDPDDIDLVTLSVSIATDNPTWTNHYAIQDSINATSLLGMQGASAQRSSSNATGSATATISNGIVTYGAVMIAIGTPTNVTVSATPLIMTTTVPSATITGTANVTVTPLIGTGTLPNATITAKQNTEWTNEAITSTDWTLENF